MKGECRIGGSLPSPQRDGREVELEIENEGLMGMIWSKRKFGKDIK